MISNAGLTKDFWGEVISMACYNVNRTSFVTLDFKIFEKIWLDAPTDYSDIKIFGYPTYMYMNNRKLKSRLKKCIFLR